MNKGAFVEFEGRFAQVLVDTRSYHVQMAMSGPTYTLHINAVAVKFVHATKISGSDATVISFGTSIDSTSLAPNFLYVLDTVENVLAKLNYAIAGIDP